MRHITLLYSPLNAPLGLGTLALRQRWSERSSKNDADFEDRDEPPRELKREEEMEELKPRARFARMISSKRRILESAAGVVSRSWMNSLKAR